MIESGIASLNTKAQEMRHPDYLTTGWEAERVEILKGMESRAFFQTIRGGLVVGLYNQKPVWDHLGYEGASFVKGGYLDRGFDDVKGSNLLDWPITLTDLEPYNTKAEFKMGVTRTNGIPGLPGNNNFKVKTKAI